MSFKPITSSDYSTETPHAMKLARIAAYKPLSPWRIVACVAIGVIGAAIIAALSYSLIDQDLQAHAHSLNSVGWATIGVDILLVLGALALMVYGAVVHRRWRQIRNEMHYQVKCDRGKLGEKIAQYREDYCSQEKARLNEAYIMATSKVEPLTVRDYKLIEMASFKPLSVAKIVTSVVLGVLVAAALAVGTYAALHHDVAAVASYATVAVDIVALIFGLALIGLAVRGRRRAALKKEFVQHLTNQGNLREKVEACERYYTEHEKNALEMAYREVLPASVKKSPELVE